MIGDIHSYWQRMKGRWEWRLPWTEGSVNVKMILFLVLVLNVKLAVKIPALLLICLLQPDLHLGFRMHSSRLPLFYPLIIAVGLIDWCACKGWRRPDYSLTALMGIFFWVLCILAAHQVRLFAETTAQEVFHRTLLVFFLLNAGVSFVMLARIGWEIKSINPFLYQGMHQKYFIRTGDYIKGITFDTSTTNAMINAFGVVYFLFRKNGGMVLCCMACLLITGSNFTNLLLLAVFVVLFCVASDREQKGGIILCIVMGAFFLGKVSPQNNTYTEETFDHWLHPTAARGTLTSRQPSLVRSVDEQRRSIATKYLDSLRRSAVMPTTNRLVVGNWTSKHLLPVDDINSAPFQVGTDTTPGQRELLRFIDTHQTQLPLGSAHSVLPLNGRIPGKLLAWAQTWSFFQSHPGKIVAGDGMGNFSSKLSFRTTGLDMAGGYPARYVYISPDFLTHHLDLYLAYFSKQKDQHSLTNSPDSVWVQMLSEYGLIGLSLFCVGYLGFFFRRLQRSGQPGSYKGPLLLLMAAAFFMGYWFEQLSIVVLFELLFFADSSPVFTTQLSSCSR